MVKSVSYNINSVGGELLLLKKIVVVFPYPDEKGTIGQKTFKVADKEAEYLEVNNTEQGCLVIMCKAELPHYKPLTLAVFKEWMFWERIA